jgi:ATP-dependent DNA ligase
VFDVPAQQMLDSACRLGLEGVIAKRRDSAYVTRRSSDWIKLKCKLRQEFVIGGWTDPKGSRTGIGSLAARRARGRRHAALRPATSEPLQRAGAAANCARS